MSERVIRVFPRQTQATPTDELAYIGPPEFWTEADRVEISVAFTWDLPRAEWLAEQWRRVGPVTIGGPAAGTRGEEFVPGRFLKPGYVITSRGCPNDCWFCEVWRRDGPVRELPIREGWKLQDDNLLACSEGHIRRVFEMLGRQPRRVEFTGGLEAARLEDWHVDLLAGLRPQPVVFFAYDQPYQFWPLGLAVVRLRAAGFRFGGHRVRCYVLIGTPRDTFDAAERRLRRVTRLGLTPFAMLWRGENEKTCPEWERFQRRWARPAIIHARGGV